MDRTHCWGNQFYVMLLCVLIVVITAVKRISGEFFGLQIPFFYRLDCRDKRIGITFMGRLNLDMGDQVKGFFFFVFIIAVRFP